MTPIQQKRIIALTDKLNAYYAGLASEVGMHFGVHAVPETTALVLTATNAGAPWHVEFVNVALVLDAAGNICDNSLFSGNAKEVVA